MEEGEGLDALPVDCCDLLTADVTLAEGMRDFGVPGDG